MKDPLLVEIFIIGALDEDIRFILPLQLKFEKLYFITIERFLNMLKINQFIQCGIEEITICIQIQQLNE